MPTAAVRRLLDESDLGQISWPTLLLFGGGLSLGSAVNRVDIDLWLATLVQGLEAGPGPIPWGPLVAPFVEAFEADQKRFTATTLLKSSAPTEVLAAAVPSMHSAHGVFPGSFAHGPPP